MNKYLISNSLENIFGENISIKNILNRNSVKHILRNRLSLILKSIFSLKSIFEKILRVYLIVIFWSVFNIFNTWKFLSFFEMLETPHLWYLTN